MSEQKSFEARGSGTGTSAEGVAPPAPDRDEMARAAAAETPGPARNVIRMGLVVLVALAAVLAGALGLRACSASATQKATEAALAAAKTRTAQLLSFSAPTLEPDLARARQQVTGDFAPRFNQLLDTLIVPSIQQRSITTKATVARAGVVSVEPAKVVILLFINQETTTAARATPVQATSQAKVTMTKVGDAWLISDFAPI